MNVTIAAIFENGMLKPQQPLELAEGAQVQVTINSASPATSWSEEGERRRRELIDKDIQGSITADERIELERLDRLANEYFDEISPPPMDGARRLHDRLMNRSH
jgi:predicted DNA-binding antitoxin AbrB/MazE fold protein